MHLQILGIVVKIVYVNKEFAEWKAKSIIFRLESVHDKVKLE